MKHARVLDDEHDRLASKEASLAHSKDGRKGKGDLVDAMNPLIALRGCGPATASAFMSCADDRFLSFRMKLWQSRIGNGNNDKDRYSLARYREFMKALQQRSDELGAKISPRLSSRLRSGLPLALDDAKSEREEERLK